MPSSLATPGSTVCSKIDVKKTRTVPESFRRRVVRPVDIKRLARFSMKRKAVNVRFESNCDIHDLTHLVRLSLNHYTLMVGQWALRWDLHPVPSLYSAALPMPVAYRH